MDSNFQELWDGSRAFRQLFVFNGIFRSPNDVDVGKAEVMWWNRYPNLFWDFCGHDGCGRLVVKGERCQKHTPPGTRPIWKWHSGLLYRYLSAPFFVGDKGTNGGCVSEYRAYHLHVWKRVFGEITAGYSVYFADSNPFNLKEDNLILLSRVMIAAVRAGEVSVCKAMEMDDVLEGAIVEGCGRGRPKAQWAYTAEGIARAAKIKQPRVRQEISRGNLDPSDLGSVADFIHHMRGVCDGSLSKVRKIG